MSLTLKEEKSASYGRHMKMLKRIEQAQSTKKESRFDNSTATISLEKRAQDIRVWKEFPKQNLAIQFYYSCRYRVGVFSFESAKFGTSGQRHFVVSSYHTFVHRYLNYILEEKINPHFYEVIVEGTACRLYFDIEFPKLLNPNINGVELLEIFIQFVCYCLHSIFGISCDRHNVMDLDSTSGRKFSRHLIFHLPNTAFQNSREVGKFVVFICDELRTLRSTDSMHFIKPVQTESANKLSSWKPNLMDCPNKESLLRLFVNNDKGYEVLICDEGVYTKNRNFRLYRSSKLGKDIDLRLAKENKFVSKHIEPGISEENNNTKVRVSKHINILFDSLICYILFEENLRILSFTHPGLQPESNKDIFLPHIPTHTQSVLLDYRESSPFPPLDKFIQHFITRDNSPGKIRRVTYLSESKLVIYDIIGYRYCENIQRHHKSNNIMLLANIEKMTYYQKCYDPECKRAQFRSNEMPIPLEFMQDFTNNTVEEYTEYIDIDTIADFDDNDDDELSDKEWMRISEELETSIYSMET
ncbi:DNA-directed primase/polymerase protein [Oopsacas minuta]|uniref:DNA-directed primase/polymerase protein n=1 Tax=Oopsacas minuta TaxID=111878 RepID=A0AAV7JY03_9METZ|nr:DNA-directed primase/polymerase protein [Oopsacas minuta]